jgi:hypothetical protein
VQSRPPNLHDYVKLPKQEEESFLKDVAILGRLMRRTHEKQVKCNKLERDLEVKKTPKALKITMRVALPAAENEAYHNEIQTIVENAEQAVFQLLVKARQDEVKRLTEEQLTFIKDAVIKLRQTLDYVNELLDDTEDIKVQVVMESIVTYVKDHMQYIRNSCVWTQMTTLRKHNEVLAQQAQADAIIDDNSNEDNVLLLVQQAIGKQLKPLQDALKALKQRPNGQRPNGQRPNGQRPNGKQGQRTPKTQSAKRGKTQAKRGKKSTTTKQPNKGAHGQGNVYRPPHLRGDSDVSK